MTTYRIVETGQRLNGLELDLQLLFGTWSVRDREGETWHVRTRDGETLTVTPVTD
ncbi:hypothetical protein ACFQL1_22135 [Halomicroarcula sp. GCM10025709]|uniref:hypothetical protein n=1 Tax=Haloarcula TaxID=2237 RepID=UPI0024C3BD85|nr:hypothetical protein [Halomicroarcula sp. YJ-61-S]